MLYAEALRGEDSTGAFCVNKYGNVKMIKSAQRADSFINTKTFDSFLEDAYKEGRVLVGHNRSATKGSLTDENAHPFIEGNTCLVHNGTLYNHKHLADTDVDSHAICHAFEKDGYTKSIPELNGAFALIWYDAKEKKLHITRNKERPLWIIETKDADYIASEDGMLEWLANRVHGVTEKAKYFQVGQIYSYDLEKLAEGYDMEEAPQKKALPVVTPATVVKGTVLTKDTQKSIGPKLFMDYRYGTEVILKQVSNSATSTGFTLVGRIIDNAQTRCVATITRTEMEESEWMDLCIAEYIKATVFGVSFRARRQALSPAARYPSDSRHTRDSASRKGVLNPRCGQRLPRRRHRSCF